MGRLKVIEPRQQGYARSDKDHSKPKSKRGRRPGTTPVPLGADRASRFHTPENNVTPSRKKTPSQLSPSSLAEIALEYGTVRSRICLRRSARARSLSCAQHTAARGGTLPPLHSGSLQSASYHYRRAKARTMRKGLEKRRRS